MRKAIEMPKLGFDMDAGQIARWLKQVGDSVRRGEAIAEIETDKATIEMEALGSGILVEIVEAAGSEVPVGAIIGYLEADALP